MSRTRVSTDRNGVLPRPAPLLRLVALLLGLLALTTVVQAEDDATPVDVAADGLAGLDHIGMPMGGPDAAVGLQVGYGWTESIGTYPGSHHRLMGQAAASLPILPGLSAALRFDGRFDVHPDDGLGIDVGGVGEPALGARYGAALSKDFQLGGEANVRMPGTSAPSVKLSATTVELKALAAYLGFRPLSLHALAGFRFDNSGHAAPDRARLREGDRIALGLSEGNHLLLGLGAHYRFSEATSGYAEWTFDPMPGYGVILASPMRLSVGARQRLDLHWQLEAKLVGSLSRRPDIASDAPMVPIEPRIALSFGIRYVFAEPPPVPLPVEPDLPEEPEEAPPAPTQGPLSGTLLGPDGAPLTGARVKISRGEASWEASTDDEGHYHIERIPFGELTLEASAEGYRPLSWTFDHSAEGPGAEPVAAKQLEREHPTGQLRGLIRSWNSEPLAADVVISDLGGKPVQQASSDREGRFQLELPEGAYRVKVSAPGHKSQQRRVRIHYRGVTILNVDLRTARRRR